MGADESKGPNGRGEAADRGWGDPGGAAAAVDFPNTCGQLTEAMAWTLLHQCTLDNWKDGHAGAAGFAETILTCDGLLHKDCNFSFCMSRQGIISINKANSIFSFRKRSKFAKMAEHFEYNHIPAQMSSINHFRVKSVLCFRENLVVLHLTRNTNSHFGLLDLGINKFLGVFGNRHVEFANEALAGEISPDQSKCLLRMPTVPGHARPQSPVNVVLQLYDLKAMQLLSEIELYFNACHFCFDPRFTWQRVAVTNFEANQTNSLSLVQLDTWQTAHTNSTVTDIHRTLYPYMKDLSYSRDGSLLIAVIVDVTCYCREKRMRTCRPLHCSIYIFSGDTSETLHCIQYHRYTCARHLCPVNYTPVLSVCGNRMAILMNIPYMPGHNYVQVYKLPTVNNLQSLCRIVILQNFATHHVPQLPLPQKIIDSLQFKPEF